MLEITDNQLQTVLSVLEQHVPDAEVWAFGSRVKGEARPHSDLDLVVVGDDRLSLRKLGEIIEAFQDSDLPFRVDVADWHRVSPEFREIISACHVKIKPRSGRQVSDS